MDIDDGPERERSRQAWSSYWQHGALHSCTGAYAGNYDGVVAAFWSSCFSRLSAAATVVDIGTGNGAVARLAFEHAASARASWRVHGVDSAAIRPELPGDAEALAGIVFHPNTAAEQLPFPDAFVDLLCGQYALEYTDLDRVLPEFRRVLRSDGGLAFVVHAEDSAVTRIARQEDAIDSWLLEQCGYFSAARELLRQMARYAPVDWRRQRYDVEARHVHERFSHLARECVQRRDTMPQTQVLAAAMDQFAAAIGILGDRGIEPALTHLTGVEAELRAHHRRLREQIAAACDAAAIESLCARIEDGGFGPTRSQHLRDGELLLGWTVCAGAQSQI